MKMSAKPDIVQNGRSLEEFETELDGLAAYSEKIPLLPLTAFDREAIYQDQVR
jgi:hypothetical protein